MLVDYISNIKIMTNKQTDNQQKVLFKSTPNIGSIIVYFVGLLIPLLFFYQMNSHLEAEIQNIGSWILAIIFLTMGLGSLWFMYYTFANSVVLKEEELIINNGIKIIRIPIMDITRITSRYIDGGNHFSYEATIYTIKDDKGIEISSLQMGNYWVFLNLLSKIANKEIVTL